MLTMVGRYAYPHQEPSPITIQHLLFTALRNRRNRRKSQPRITCSHQRLGSMNCPFQPHRMDLSASFRDLMATSGSPSLAAIALGASLPRVPLSSFLFLRPIVTRMGSPLWAAISGSLNPLA